MLSISGAPRAWQNWSSLSDRKTRVGKLPSLLVNNRIGLAPTSIFVRPTVPVPSVGLTLMVVADFPSQLTTPVYPD